ncbi:MAG: hypothetical protein IKZ58_03935 [Selenomonadaceae bacterium]|nr:hypothetical protein [Selenomonadaceae bacterium]
MFTLNYLMPLHRDDYDYSMIWGTKTHVNSILDVFESTYQHYLLHGGRAFTVFCLNFFLWLGKFPFDVANAILFTALVVLIYFHARREIKLDEPIILAVTGLLTWLSLPHFGEVAVWKSGSTVYLWSAVPALIFLLPYNLTLAGKINLRGKILPAVVMFFMGIIAGCSVENLGVTVTLLTGAITFYLYKKNRPMHWAAAGSLGSLIGAIILIAAPGNFVRYDVQGEGKGILAHIGNQIAGNAEMFLYLLPAVLILICALNSLKEDGETLNPKTLKLKPIIIVTIIFTISYFFDSLITTTISNFFVNHIFPALDTSEKFIERFENFMSKSEEMIIYWLIIILIYLPLRRALGVKKFGIVDALKNFAEVRYATILFLLAIFNNLVMIFAPTFPARSTFSSVVMILIGIVAVIRLPLVREKFSVPSVARILKLGALSIGGFTIIAALFITYTLKQENDWRINEVAKAAEKYKPVVTFPPITLKNRALRHVFFVDFDNGVTRDGVCKYYGIAKIVVKDKS